MSDEPSPTEDTPAEAPPAAAASDDSKAGAARTRRIVTGAAIGIGSAALVAALLYANRSRKGGKA